MEEGKKQEKCEAYCGKMKRDLEGVKPASLGASKKKKLLRTKSLGKEEAQKSTRKLEAERSQLGSRRPRSPDDKGKEENSKQGIKSARRRPRPWPSPHGTHRVGADEDEGAERSRADMSSCLKRCLLYERESLLRGFIVRWI